MDPFLPSSTTCMASTSAGTDAARSWTTSRRVVSPVNTSPSASTTASGSLAVGSVSEGHGLGFLSGHTSHHRLRRAGVGARLAHRVRDSERPIGRVGTVELVIVHGLGLVLFVSHGACLPVG